MHLNLSKMFSKTCIGFMVGLLVVCVGSIPVETPAKPLAKTPAKPAPKDSPLGMILPPGMGGCNPGMNCPMNVDPVCATDGRTYPNMCVLRSVQSCHPMPMIYLKHYGRCGSRPCMVHCPNTYNPVCGSDGNTYNSKCLLDRERMCKNKPNLYLVRYGRCSMLPPCRSICHKIHHPVCGNDGKTYDNACELDNARRCDNKPNLDVLHNGHCAPPPSCRRICSWDPVKVCGSDGKTYDNACELGNSRRCDNKPLLRVAHNGDCFPPPSCRRTCKWDMFKVCGTDGKTYDNACKLDNAKRCDNKPGLHVAHDGACFTPPSCRRVCPLTAQKVCGTDDKTYENACELDNVKRCDNKPGLHVAHDGPCAPKPCMVSCPSDYAPVCGTDGKTYMNSCLLGAAKRCENKPSLAIDHFGPC